MMPFINYENDNLPLSNLPKTFNARLIQLAPGETVNKLTLFSETCPDIESHSRRRHKFYNSVFVTDNSKIYSAALEDVYFDPMSHWYHSFKGTRYLYDGPYTFDPKWDSVVHANELNERRQLYVEDTLIIHCEDVKVYKKVIPLITGRYSRLVIYGRISWQQIKQLIHANVSQVRIEGIVYLNPSEYKDTIEYINRFSRGFMYKFSFRRYCFPTWMTEKLREVCKLHDTHTLVRDERVENFVHKNYRCIYDISAILSVLPSFCFMLFMGYLYDYDFENENSIFFQVWMGILILGYYITIVRLSCLLALKSLNNVPLNDYRVFTSAHKNE
uniref:Uncharacterized protein n=1 Tax=Panagrellus redivivus TaxID=6233 RepID=A0A7E4UN20_PANRE